jgi:hypothetical protein
VLLDAMPWITERKNSITLNYSILTSFVTLLIVLCDIFLLLLEDDEKVHKKVFNDVRRERQSEAKLLVRLPRHVVLCCDTFQGWAEAETRHLR